MQDRNLKRNLKRNPNRLQAIAFESATYRSQVFRLRKLAREVLQHYPISVKSLSFINHGENATFRVDAKNGKRFLLRIHRGDYHSDRAILEEINWLQRLEKRKVRVPRPLLSKRNQWIEHCETPEVGRPRQCVVFEWIDGYFLEKSIRPRHMFELGKLIATLQQSVPLSRSTNRIYWDANGLVGAKPKFGSISKLLGVTSKNQRIINQARGLVFKKLHAFETKFPERMGTIHADLHFGNIVQTKEGLCAIDFDDSGFGFRVYDLVVPLLSAQRSFGPKRVKEFEVARSALIEGYSSIATFDQHDKDMLKHLTAARKITMLGWLHSRSDNPRLAKHLQGSAQAAVDFLTANYPKLKPRKP